MTSVLLAASPAVAGSSLPVDSVACSTREAMGEAEQALARKDRAWLGSLVRCFHVTTAMEADRLDCGGSICRVRLFAPDGQTPVLYTLRAYLD